MSLVPRPGAFSLPRSWPRLTAAVLLLAAALPASALYKVVGPDGKVTYTDRPPPPAAAGGTPAARVTPLASTASAPGAADTALQALPAELRQAATRYPATLYVIPNCAPCESARALLRQRGVPYTEKMVATEDDAQALQRLTGTRNAPTLTLGAQPLDGLSPDAWNAYLDSAGYPRQSRLPAGYQFQAATPLVDRRDTARPALPQGGRRPGEAQQPDGTGADTAPAAPAAPASGIRF